MIVQSPDECLNLFAGRDVYPDLQASLLSLLLAPIASLAAAADT